MRALGLALVVSAVSAVAPPAFADSQIQIGEGTIRVVGAASGRGKSVWARGRSLVVVVPPGKLQAETLKVEGSFIKDVRLVARKNRGEITLRLKAPADTAFGRVSLDEQGADLLIRVKGEPALKASTAPVAPAAVSPARPRAIHAAVVPKVAAVPAPVAAAGSPRPEAKPSQPASGNTAALLGRTTGSDSKQNWRGLLKAQRKGGGGGLGKGSFFAFAFVVFGAGAAWWLKRQRRGSAAAANAGEIGVISSRALSAKQRLVVVEVEGERLLLGCTEKEICLLRTLDGPHAGLATAAAGGAQEGGRRESLREEDVPASMRGIFEDASRSASSASANSETASWRRRMASSRFVEQLNARIGAGRRETVEPAAPLDEKWAEGILRLRRQRREQGQQEQSI